MKLTRQIIILNAITQGHYSATAGGKIISHRCGGKFMKEFGKPYPFTRLIINNKRYITLVQHFVWLFFNGIVPPLFVIVHENGDVTNNAIDNLALSTTSSLLKQQYAQGKRTPRRGVLNEQSRFSDEQVATIRNNKTLFIGQLAKLCGVGRSTIRRIIHHQSYKGET